MGWLFNCLYALAGLALAPHCLWRRTVRGKSLAGFREKISGRVGVAGTRSNRVWLHAVSVGEVNLLVHLLPRLQEHWPDCEFIVSTTTAAGYELAQRRFGPERTCFFPFDFSWSIREAFDRIRPRLILLVELEIWPNLLRMGARRQVPIAIVNGRLGRESFRAYRRFRWLFRSSFAKLAWVGAQNREYADRFLELGVQPSRITITGNLKFDGAQSDRGNPQTVRCKTMVPGSPREIVWLAGSTQDPEEQIAIECYRSLRRDYPELRLILAPRHPERCASVVKQIRDRQLTAIRRTELVDSRRVGTDEILVIDTVGELAAWWGLCDIAFVGGSLGDRGGQNMIEPAAFGCAVSFGPNTKNFRDVVALLLSQRAAVVVHNARELEDFVGRCLADRSWRRELGSHAQRLVASQTGATGRTLERLDSLIGRGPAVGGRAA